MRSLLYLISADPDKADRAERQLDIGAVVSVQVLNEFASVATRKRKMPIEDIREISATLRAVCSVVPVSEETHDLRLQVAERYALSVYDAMIVSAALLAGCKTLLSEDMPDDQEIDGQLQIQNPFRAT